MATVSDGFPAPDGEDFRRWGRVSVEATGRVAGGEFGLPEFLAVSGASRAVHAQADVARLAELGWECAASPHVHVLGVFPVVERHATQLVAGKGAAAPGVGDDWYAGSVFTNDLGSALDECGDVFSGEDSPVHRCGVAEMPCGGAHVVPVAVAHSPCVVECLERGVFVHEPFAEELSGFIAEAEISIWVLGEVEPHVRFVDGFVCVCTGTDMAANCADKASFQVLDQGIVWAESRPTAGRRICACGRFEGVSVLVHIPAVLVFGDCPFGGAVEMEEEDDAE